MAVTLLVPCIAHIVSCGSIWWTSYYLKELSQSVLLAKMICIVSIVLLWNMTHVIVFTNQEACNICQYNTGSIKHLKAQSTPQPSSDNSLAIDTGTFHHILMMTLISWTAKQRLNLTFIHSWRVLSAPTGPIQALNPNWIFTKEENHRGQSTLPFSSQAWPSDSFLHLAPSPSLPNKWCAV